MDTDIDELLENIKRVAIPFNSACDEATDTFRNVLDTLDDIKPGATVGLEFDEMGSISYEKIGDKWGIWYRGKYTLPQDALINILSTKREVRIAMAKRLPELLEEIAECLKRTLNVLGVE